MNKKRVFAGGALAGAAAVALFTTAPGWLLRKKLREALRSRGLYPPVQE